MTLLGNLLGYIPSRFRAKQSGRKVKDLKLVMYLVSIGREEDDLGGRAPLLVRDELNLWCRRVRELEKRVRDAEEELKQARQFLYDAEVDAKKLGLLD